MVMMAMDEDDIWDIAEAAGEFYSLTIDGVTVFHPPVARDGVDVYFKIDARSAQFSDLSGHAFSWLPATPEQVCVVLRVIMQNMEQVIDGDHGASASYH